MLIELEQATLQVVVEGPEDAPVITFSNSLMTDMRLWAPQVGALAGRYRILRYDQRGHGRSTSHDPAYDLDDLAGDIIGIWDRLGIERSHLVGLSMGGMTALGLALDAPERLLTCTLCSMRADAPDSFRNSWDERIALAREKGMAALAGPTEERWFPQSFHDGATRSLVRKMVAETPLAGFLGGVGAIRGLDYAGRVGELRLPVQFLAGGRDGVLPEAMESLAGQVPQSLFKLFPHAGHLLNLECPEEFAGAIAEMVDRHHGLLT